MAALNADDRIERATALSGWPVLCFLAGTVQQYDRVPGAGGKPLRNDAVSSSPSRASGTQVLAVASPRESIVVGVSGGRRNPAAAVALDGRLLAFCEQERLTRIRGG